MKVLLKSIAEGLGLGVLLVLVCAVGIRKGAVPCCLKHWATGRRPPCCSFTPWA